MIINAASEMDIDLKQSWMIGNSDRDVKAGKNAGCTTIFIDNLPHYEQPDLNRTRPDYTAVNLTEAVNIIKHFHRLSEKGIQNRSRAEQLKADTLTKGRISICDYIFDKTRIYANNWLNAQQWDLYEKIYSRFCSSVTAPALVIYLTDSPQNCLERIVKRNRPYEQKIEPPFLEALGAGYENLFHNWKTCPVIRLQKSKFDYFNNANIVKLINQIKSYVAI